MLKYVFKNKIHALHRSKALKKIGLTTDDEIDDLEGFRWHLGTQWKTNDNQILIVKNTHYHAIYNKIHIHQTLKALEISHRSRLFTISGVLLQNKSDNSFFLIDKNQISDIQPLDDFSIRACIMEASSNFAELEGFLYHSLLSQKELYQIASKIVSSLLSLQEKNIILLDLDIHNIAYNFITKEIKSFSIHSLIDLKKNPQDKIDHLAKSIVQTKNQAPEAIDKNHPNYKEYGIKINSWNIGVLLINIILDQSITTLNEYNPNILGNDYACSDNSTKIILFAKITFLQKKAILTQLAKRYVVIPVIDLICQLCEYLPCNRISLGKCLNKLNYLSKNSIEEKKLVQTLYKNIHQDYSILDFKTYERLAKNHSTFQDCWIYEPIKIKKGYNTISFLLKSSNIENTNILLGKSNNTITNGLLNNRFRVAIKTLKIERSSIHLLYQLKLKFHANIMTTFAAVLKNKSEKKYKIIDTNYPIDKKLIHNNFIVAFILEHIDGKPLSYFIREDILSCKDIYEIITQLTNSLIFLHKQGFIHTDIKPDNIMYNQEKKLLKLIDLDNIININEKNINQHLNGMGYGEIYMDPEYFINPCNPSVCDIPLELYSLGTLILKLILKRTQANYNFKNKALDIIFTPYQPFKDLSPHIKAFNALSILEKKQVIYKLTHMEPHYQNNKFFYHSLINTACSLIERNTLNRLPLKMVQKKMKGLKHYVC